MKLDPVLLTLLARAGERIALGARRYDPGSRIALERLAEQMIAFEFTEPEFNLYLTVVDGQPRLLTYTEQIPHCRLRGTLADIAALALQKPVNLAGSGVEVFGNAALLAQLQALLAQLDIDWEEPLNRLLGDVAGHSLAEGVRQVGNKVRQSGGKLPGYLAQYITEDAQLVPAQEEVDGFCEAVDRLRADVDRLEARLTQLTHHYNSKI